MKPYIYPQQPLMNRIFFSLLLLHCCCYGQAQIITRYFDDNWQPTLKEKATYYSDFEKDGDLYRCTSYYIETGKVSGRSVYSDTSFGFAEGLSVRYTKNNTLEDSAYYKKDRSMVYGYHYHPNGKLAGKYYLPEGANDEVMEGYDEEGKRIKNYIFFREAQFKGGSQRWIDFLTKNLSKEFTTKSNTEEHKRVVVEFIVDKSGYVVETKIFESSGNSALDADAVRTIQSSPQWIPAVQFNRPVNAYRRQPLTYVLYPAAKRR
jgi:TonB family protein